MVMRYTVFFILILFGSFSYHFIFNFNYCSNVLRIYYYSYYIYMHMCVWHQKQSDLINKHQSIGKSMEQITWTAERKKRGKVEL